jgi:hypothetical protein
MGVLDHHDRGVDHRADGDGDERAAQMQEKERADEGDDDALLPSPAANL